MIKNIEATGKLLVFFILLTLTACADSPPFPSGEIDQADKSVRLSRLMDSPGDYTGRTVIVGGVINVVERQGILNRIYVQAYPLDSSYHPDLSRHPAGHFMIVTDQPLSPGLYAPGRTIEVLGTVHKTQVMPNFADRTERVVVIKARSLHVRRRPLPPPRGIGFGYMPMMGF